jgi:hypothetical protein
MCCCLPRFVIIRIHIDFMTLPEVSDNQYPLYNCQRLSYWSTVYINSSLTTTFSLATVIHHLLSVLETLSDTFHPSPFHLVSFCLSRGLSVMRHRHRRHRRRPIRCRWQRYSISQFPDFVHTSDGWSVALRDTVSSLKS